MWPISFLSLFNELANQLIYEITVENLTLANTTSLLYMKLCSTCTILSTTLSHSFVLFSGVVYNDGMLTNLSRCKVSWQKNVRAYKIKRTIVCPI